MATIPEREDAEMIANPDRWPAWPILPVKRRGWMDDDCNLGVVLDEGTRSTVYHVNICDLPKTQEGWIGAAKTHYATVEAMLKDGWIVD